MIGGGFSLFGFDLFGMTRRAASEPESEAPRFHVVPEKDDDDRDAHRLPDREYSESFFWGMYPVY